MFTSLNLKPIIKVIIAILLVLSACYTVSEYFVVCKDHFLHSLIMEKASVLGLRLLLHVASNSGVPAEGTIMHALKCLFHLPQLEQQVRESLVRSVGNLLR